MFLVEPFFFGNSRVTIVPDVPFDAKIGCGAGSEPQPRNASILRHSGPLGLTGKKILDADYGPMRR